jgi:hypothetical protein
MSEVRMPRLTWRHPLVHAGVCVATGTAIVLADTFLL